LDSDMAVKEDGAFVVRDDGTVRVVGARPVRPNNS
jgi:hypothetical protein